MADDRSTWGPDDAPYDYPGDLPLPSRARRNAQLPPLRDSLPRGLGGLRRDQLYQGSYRRHPRLPLVVSDGSLWELWHDDQRYAEAQLRRLPARVLSKPRPGRTAGQLPGGTRPRHRLG